VRETEMWYSWSSPPVLTTQFTDPFLDWDYHYS
jgi:hypothetical protein